MSKSRPTTASTTTGAGGAETWSRMARVAGGPGAGAPPPPPPGVEDPQRPRSLGPRWSHVGRDKRTASTPDRVEGRGRGREERRRSLEGDAVSSVPTPTPAPASGHRASGREEGSDTEGVWARGNHPEQVSLTEPMSRRGKRVLSLHRPSRFLTTDGGSGTDQGQPTRHPPGEEQLTASPPGKRQDSTRTKIPDTEMLSPKPRTTNSTSRDVSLNTTGFLASRAATFTSGGRLGTTNSFVNNNDRPAIPKFVPVFRPKTASGNSSSGKKSHSVHPGSSGVDTPSQGRGPGGLNKIVPVFKPKPKPTRPPNPPFRAVKPAPPRSAAARPTPTPTPTTPTATGTDAAAVSCPEVTSSSGSAQRRVDRQPLPPGSGAASSVPAPRQPAFLARRPQFGKAADFKSPSARSCGPKTLGARTPLAGKLKQRMLEAAAGKAGAQSPVPVAASPVGAGGRGVEGTRGFHGVAPSPSSSQGKRKVDSQVGGEIIVV